MLLVVVIALLYGQRAYDGSDLTVQNRFLNKIPSPHHLAVNWPSALAGLDTYQISDNISITPGVFYISGVANSDGIGAGSSWGGVIKTQFNF